jgi:molecular chaperone GrpE
MTNEQRNPEDAANEYDQSDTNVTVEQLLAQVAEEKARAESFYGSWQRSAADFQNYKRRVEQEKEEMARWANASLILNILPVVDDLERALKSLDSNLAGLTWVEGIYQIVRKFQQSLASSGVTEIPSDGETFDPRVHEAVTYAAGEDGRVVGVIQKGYKLGDRILRPAMVVVGQGSPQSKTSDEEQPSEQN